MLRERIEAKWIDCFVELHLFNEVRAPVLPEQESDFAVTLDMLHGNLHGRTCR